MQLNLVYYFMATVLGGLHALEPGHGKTVVAAYLIGSKGRKIDAVLLGLVVTFTHTFSVILLAVLAKIASERMALTEESLHGYLGFVAGGLILAVGLWMLITRLQGKEPFHGHSHGHGHDHHHEPFLGEGDDKPHSGGNPSHHPGTPGEGKAYDFLQHEDGEPLQPHDHEHPSDDSHEHHHHEHEPGVEGHSRVTYWQLALLGVSGGMIPCPAAIAVLLAAAAAGKLGEGITYILLFSLGLAVALIAIGLIVLGAGKVASRFLDAKRFARKVAIASAGIITFIGLVTVVNSVRHVISL